MAVKPSWAFQLTRAAGLAALAVPQIAWLAQPIPLSFKLGHVALVGLALARPADALLVLAGLGPLTTAIGFLAPTPLNGWWLLEQAVLAVITGVVARHRPDDGRTRSGRTALVVAAVAMASVAALLPTRWLANDPNLSAWQRLTDLLHGEYYTASGLWMPVIRAVATLEGMALLWATELMIRRDQVLATRLIRLALAGSAAAASLSLSHIVAAALRSGDLHGTLPALLLMARYSMSYDMNAAASVFVLVFLSGVALLARAGLRVLPIGAALCLVGGGLWLTGSRTALAAVVIAPIGIALAQALRRNARRRWLTLATVAGIALCAGLLVRAYPSSRNWGVNSSVMSRLILAKTAVRMTASAPVFGIGIGRFQEASPEFGSAELVPTYRNSQAAENAHNNFLQVLAEQGVIGLTAFVLLLGVVIAPAWPRGDSSARLRPWLLAGVLGFVLTWFTGHPLLVPEAALTFWMFFGVLAALTPEPVPVRWQMRTAWIAAAVLLVSVPVRASRTLATADLEYRAIGTSGWMSDDGGIRFRQAGPMFALYLPADKLVVLPLRRAADTPDPLRVELRLAGQLLQVWTVRGSAWQMFHLRFHSRSLFERIDVKVAAEGGAPLPVNALQVGKEFAW